MFIQNQDLTPQLNPPQFGLLDCNNFYVSCERVFQPTLNKAPVIVLSNNDGCVVSRSNEAKRLDIKMGVPAFKLKALIQAQKIKVFSSNYALYNDMSQRVMGALAELAPNLEIYSIDEAFLDLTGFHPNDLSSFGENLVKTIQQWTGIPVSLGMGSTKTLAKVADHIAKKNKMGSGVFKINATNREHVLAQFKIEDVWGIGKNWATKLNQRGIVNAYELSQRTYPELQKQFNKTLASTALELQGIPIHKIETIKKLKKEIMVSRSFGRMLTDYDSLREAIATHTAQAIQRLRSQHAVAKTITIFLQTNRFQQPKQPYHYDTLIELPIPSQDTRDFLKAAEQGLKQLYKSKPLAYKKAGVILREISSKGKGQIDLFSTADPKAVAQIEVLDRINRTFGKGTCRFAVEGYTKAWLGQSRDRSRAYTTCWSELPIVQAK